MRSMDNGQMTSPTKICFVCTGNICRSTMGEVVFRQLIAQAGAEQQFVVTSRGTHDYHEGDRADSRTLAALSAVGYDGRSHRASRVSQQDLVENHLLVALDRGHRQILSDLGCPDDKLVLLTAYDPNRPLDPDVMDPYYGTPQDFTRVLEQIERCCASLLETYLH